MKTISLPTKDCECCMNCMPRADLPASVLKLGTSRYGMASSESSILTLVTVAKLFQALAVLVLVHFMLALAPDTVCHQLRTLCA